MTQIAEVRTKDFVVSVQYDEHADNPRHWGSALGNMVCWHSKYNLGDKHDFQEPQDFDLTTDNNVMLPLYLYDHSGITMSTSTFGCRWDSGQVGWYHVSHADIEKEYGAFNDETIKKAEERLIDEVKLYDLYLTGEVFGYTIQRKVYDAETNEMKLQHEDSCWGFYGSHDKSGIIDAISDFDKDLGKAVADELGVTVEVA
jgi:hypothetical protein